MIRTFQHVPLRLQEKNGNVERTVSQPRLPNICAIPDIPVKWWWLHPHPPSLPLFWRFGWSGYVRWYWTWKANPEVRTRLLRLDTNHRVYLYGRPVLPWCNWECLLIRVACPYPAYLACWTWASLLLQEYPAPPLLSLFLTWKHGTPSLARSAVGGLTLFEWSQLCRIRLKHKVVVRHLNQKLDTTKYSCGWGKMRPGLVCVFITFVTWTVMHPRQHQKTAESPVLPGLRLPH